MPQSRAAGDGSTLGPPPGPGCVDLYLELLAGCLTRNVLPDHGQKAGAAAAGVRGAAIRLVQKGLGRAGLELHRPAIVDPARRAVGQDWPSSAETMVGLERLRNVKSCIEQVLAEDVPGDLIETGVWRGGCVIYMAGVLAAYGVTDRCIWAADSFEGLPPPDAAQFPADAGDDHHTYDHLAVGVETVRANFRRYGLLSPQVRFLPGWFRDTLPNAPVERLALLRLDGDMYESTMVALESLYPRLSVGGFCIVDDYEAVPACKEAVHDYRDRAGVKDGILRIDWTGAYWRKTG